MSKFRKYVLNYYNFLKYLSEKKVGKRNSDKEHIRPKKGNAEKAGQRKEITNKIEANKKNQKVARWGNNWKGQRKDDKKVIDKKKELDYQYWYNLITLFVVFRA